MLKPKSTKQVVEVRSVPGMLDAIAKRNPGFLQRLARSVAATTNQKPQTENAPEAR